MKTIIYIRNIFFVLQLIVGIMFTSCISTSSDHITYFQDAMQISTEEWNRQYNIVPRLRPNDEFLIVVNAVDQDAASVFNKTAFVQKTTHSLQLNTVPSIQTYRVDDMGNIDFPVLGIIHVADLTTYELKNLLSIEISKFVKDPNITVTLLSMQVVVLGEVNAPGMAYFGGNRATLLEALGQRGDLTVYGNRENLLLIRENDGKREVHQIDLTSANFINSPYYYLQQNDVIYVSPNSAKRDSAKFNNLKSFNVSLVGTIVSCVSVLASLAIAIWK